MNRDNGMRTRHRPRVRLLEVAEHAGVSRATASLALRDHPSIPETTRERVRTSARDLSYVYNRAAANLRTASTQTIGIVVHDVTNPYFAEIVAEMQDALNEQGFVVLFGNTAESLPRQTTFINTIREHNVDGIVLCPAAGTDVAWVRSVQERIPIVLFARDLPDLDIDYVGVDNRNGMQEATEYLLRLGHRRIGIIGANDQIVTGRERLAGYLTALQGYGIGADQDLIIHGAATRDLGHSGLLRLLSLSEPATAAVCFNDVIAFGVMLGLLGVGREAGKDFSVVGFDDTAEATLWRPTLTSPGFALVKLARTAISLLIRRMLDRSVSPERVIIPSELRIRDSCGPVDLARSRKLRRLTKHGS